MRPVFFIAMSVALFLGVGYWYVNTAAICPVPISYRLGTVDERFAISPDELKAVFTAAEAIWEEPIGQDLFVYDDQADFQINLIFDERQQLASTEEEWRINLDQQQAEYEALLERIKELGERYKNKEASYNTRREEYEAKLATYNQQVERYNDEGGAPREVYASLQAEAKSLNQSLREITSLEEEINQLANTINELGDQGNAKIAAYNAEVLEYNEIFGTLETFTQGDYERERINIYKFTDADELTKVIAHEFGHSLGIGHVEGEESVMYYLMTERDSSSLSATDKEALGTVCGDMSTFAHQARRVIRTVLTNLNFN